MRISCKLDCIDVIQETTPQSCIDRQKVIIMDFACLFSGVALRVNQQTVRKSLTRSLYS